MFDRKRRDFITLLGGAAAAWPFAAPRRGALSNERPYRERRQFIAALCGIALSAILAGSVANARPRIGLLTLGSPQDDVLFVAAFVDGLHSHGYVESKNVDIDYRYAEGDVKRLLPLAKELIALKPDVLLATEASSARALKSVAPILPIVCPQLTDALIPELAASYARPGGSVTGIAESVEGLTGKLLELALEVVPRTLRVGFLSNPAGPSMQFFAQNIDAAARARGIAVLTEEATTRDDLAPAVDRLGKREAQALIVPGNGLFRIERAHIVQLALGVRLPTIFAERNGVEVGGLASYGVDTSENYRRAAVYVDKILKGARPGDLPIEFPTKIELVVNLKTAKALGLDVPLQLQQRADEVIE
jgi:putative ABC transport system substrate-binding protein